MNVAHLISQFYPVLGGAEICVHNVCARLAESGHRATVVTTIHKDPERPPLPYDIVHLSNRLNGVFRRVPALGSLYLRARLAAIQKQRAVDLWQVTMGYPLGIYSVEFFRKRGVPCVLRCCGEDIQKFPEIQYGYRLDPKADALARRYYPRFDGFVALTPSVRREYLDLGVPEDKIRTIPNGVDIARFRGVAKDPELRRKLGAGENAALLISVGRYHPKKGFDLIPAIAERLKAAGLDFLWLVVGRGNEALEKKFPGLAAANVRVIPKTGRGGDESAFTLPPRELIALYRAADLFAFPTLLETFGMVLVEAMAAELPIVTTDAPGVRDVIDGANGVKVKAGDVEAFAAKTLEVLRTPALRRSLAETSAAAAAAYDWRTVTAAYADFYRDTIERKRHSQN